MNFLGSRQSDLGDAHLLQDTKVAAGDDAKLISIGEALSVFATSRSDFHLWLRARKSDMIVPWVAGEACRFTTSKSPGLIFENRSGDLTTANQEAVFALTCFVRGTRWTEEPIAAPKQRQLTTAEKHEIIDGYVARFGAFCAYGLVCKGRELSRREMTLDHLVPYSVGRSNDARNFVVACRHCNRSMGHLLPVDKMHLAIKHLSSMRIGLHDDPDSPARSPWDEQVIRDVIATPKSRKTGGLRSASQPRGGQSSPAGDQEIEDARDHPDWRENWPRILAYDARKALRSALEGLD